MKNPIFWAILEHLIYYGWHTELTSKEIYTTVVIKMIHFDCSCFLHNLHNPSFTTVPRFQKTILKNTLKKIFKIFSHFRGSKKQLFLGRFLIFLASKFLFFMLYNISKNRPKLYKKKKSFPVKSLIFDGFFNTYRSKTW